MSSRQQEISDAVDRLFKYVYTHAVIDPERTEFALELAADYMANAAYQGRWGDAGLWSAVQTQLRAGTTT